jgi:hypothetical protein
MARIFLSHSSENNAQAIGVNDWLIEQGWNDLFLDLDPERGLKAGQRWQEALKKAAERCEVVLFLISPAWAASKWCLAEFLLAKQIGKQIPPAGLWPEPEQENLHPRSRGLRAQRPVPTCGSRAPAAVSSTPIPTKCATS